jgi:flagellar hook-associated protein 3 FlgL
MRISTQAMHTAAINAILKQQVALSRTQQQIATGQRVQSAADDPSAAVQLKELARLQSQHEQYAKNAVALTGRLQLEEQALADSTKVLQRIRDLVLQANSAATTTADLQAIRTEIRARVDELQGIGNQRDNTGEYLFAGLSAASKPFQRNTSGIMSYGGDGGSRTVRIDAGADMADGDAGSRVFALIKEGNGVFRTSALAANTGSASIDTGTVISPLSWVPDQYTLDFTAANTWQISNSVGAVVATGGYQSGSAIAFAGIQVSVTGVPAVGDRFAINNAATTDLYSGLDALITSLGRGVDSEAARAQMTTALGGHLLHLDQSLEHLSGVRAEVGARLSTIDDLDATRQVRLADIAGSQSQLRDLDYAAAISKMNQQMVGLQASQQSFTAIARLTLFDYL